MVVRVSGIGAFRSGVIALVLLLPVASPAMRLQGDLLAAADGARIVDAALEIAANVEEVDGLPAVIPFGPSTSLVNIDYVRLRDTGRATAINVTNAIDPRLRRCEADIPIADDTHDFPGRFMLLGGSLRECARTARNREGDLLFADGVPESLRQAVRELYEPLFNRFARLLGSEPGLVFVAWQPDSPRSDFRLEYGWSRNSLLLFDGIAWQQGFRSQREVLWETLAREQIARRLLSQNLADAFDQSAVSYLLLAALRVRRRCTCAVKG